MKKLLTLLLFLPLPLLPMVSQAELKVGDAAPEFNMQGSDGNTYTPHTLKGKPFVIAFFPKVFTGG